MADKREKRDIGLRAVSDARTARDRHKDRRISGPVAIVAGGAIFLTILTAWLLASRSLSEGQKELLAQQRAAVTTVGAEWFPLRDRIERLTLEAAGDYAGDLVAPRASSWDFRKLPGIYLRLRTAEAKDVASLRARAAESGRDAFAACLLREKSAYLDAVARGAEDAGTNADDQPWNLRQAYAATRVLEDAWADEVKGAKDELRLRVFVQQYEKAAHEDIPRAIEIVKRAQFFLLVLDEDVPEAAALADGGAITAEALQQVPHPARVHLVDLKTNEVVVRLRRTAEGNFVFAGERGIRDPEALAAVKRQVNNCALAQSVLAAIE